MPLCQNMKREMKRKIQAVTKWAKYVWVFLNFVVLFFYLLCFPRRGFLTNLDTKKSFISWNRQDGLASSRMLQGLGWQSDQNRVVFHLKATVMTVSFRKAETPPPHPTSCRLVRFFLPMNTNTGFLRNFFKRPLITSVCRISPILQRSPHEAICSNKTVHGRSHRWVDAGQNIRSVLMNKDEWSCSPSCISFLLG